MAKQSLPLKEVYRLIEPGPVVLVTTANGGRPNVMTMSWHMMVDFEPPILACVVSNRDFTFSLLKKAKECVINIPTVDLAKKVVACGNCSGRDTDKFLKFGLTPSIASLVRAPIIDECYVNLECRVIDDRFTSRYNLFILEVVKAWIDRSKKRCRTIHHRGRGVFAVDGKTIRLRSRMK